MSEPAPSYPPDPADPPGDAAAIDQRLAARLKRLRAERGWSLEALAERSGVSRATLSRVEAAQVSPTAQTLARLCAVHGLPVSRLLRDVEPEAPPLLRRDDQSVWRDPQGAVVRRSVSPPAAGFVGELVEVTLSPGAVVAYPAPHRPGAEHHLWMIEGGLTLTVGAAPWVLGPGDCLRYRLEGESRFEADAVLSARYLLAIL